MKHKFNKRLYASTLIVGFTGMIGLVSIINILSEPKVFSEEENRNLAKSPKFSIESMIDGRYTKKAEKYVSDQFPGRNYLMGIKFKSDMILGKSDENGVYICEDDYLIEEFIEPAEERLKNKIEAINNFSSKYENISKYMMLAPNAITIHKNKLPQNAPVNGQEKYIESVRDGLIDDINYVDVMTTLKEHSDEYLYYKTDHHWTTLGAYYAYLELASSMKIEPKENYYDVLPVTDEFYGTLSSKVGINYGDGDIINVYIPKDSNDEVVVKYEEEKRKTASLYSTDKLNTKDKYAMFLEGNHPILKISTTARSTDKILIIKDSYANSFVQFLTPYFSEIILVDPRYYYDNIDELIKDTEITHMLFLYNANTFFEDNSLESIIK